MGIEALYRKPNTSKKHPAHRVYPYLLRHLKIERPNQVWAMDITYIPMARGFIYLAAVVDWYSGATRPPRLLCRAKKRNMIIVCSGIGIQAPRFLGDAELDEIIPQPT